MINAVIQHKGNTLILDFPRSIYDVYEKVHSVGIFISPAQIPLTDEDGGDIRVKLYGNSDMGNHLLRLLTERDTVEDANLLTCVVANAIDDIKAELVQKIMEDRYGSMQEAIDDVRQMTCDAGPVKASFYCPLVGQLEEDGENFSEVDGYYLDDYEWAVREALEEDCAGDEQDMAAYFDRDDGVSAKLTSAVWTVASHKGRLYGKIECSLKEPLTEKEESILKEWIWGQNSDGYGEHFEQQPIETEDGDLYVSFWHSGKDYAVMNQEEFDAYIHNGCSMGLGGM